jgi:hypothetical protein
MLARVSLIGVLALVFASAIAVSTCEPDAGAAIERWRWSTPARSIVR